MQQVLKVSFELISQIIIRWPEIDKNIPYKCLQTEINLCVKYEGLSVHICSAFPFGKLITNPKVGCFY